MIPPGASGRISLEPSLGFLLQSPDMRFFWPIYLSSVIAGTAGVYFLAPLARPYVPAFLKRPESLQQPSVPGSRPAAVVKTVDVPRVQESLGTTEPSSEPPVQLETSSEELPPALNGIYLAQQGEKPGWGVTRHRTVYYTLTGTRVGTVEGGVLLDYQSMRTSSKGGMVECVLYENGSPSAPLLVGVKDVFLFTGSYGKLSPRQLTAVKTYYTLGGKISNRRNELLQAAAAKNPYFKEYQAAHQALMAQIDQAQALIAQRDKEQGAAKTRLDEQLHEMKLHENKFRVQYEAIHLKFRTWKEQHAAELGKPEDDALVQQLTKEQQALIGDMPGLAY